MNAPDSGLGAPYILRSSVARDLLRGMGAGSETLYGLPGGPLKAILAHESDQLATYETHDGADDIFYILEGSATLTMGGALVDADEVSPGEWRGTSIEGGHTQDLWPGDLVIVPRGTPHARACPGREVSLFIFKVNQEPPPSAGGSERRQK